MAGSPEFTLLVEACRAAFEGRAVRPLTLDTGPMGWPLFMRLARFHRVQGLVWQSLGREALPAEIAEQLSGDAQAIAGTNLRTALACRNLLAAINQAGVPLLFIKGLTLATLAHGTIATKSAVDIDILLGEERIGEAAELLRNLGYRLSIPSDELAQLAKWHGVRKESLWSHGESPLQIDLHTRLADNRRLISAIGLQSPRQSVEIAAGIVLPTLAADELFAYLAVHGASSAWFRLKWITDLAALLDQQTPAEFERLYRRSLELGAGRAVAQALLLADALYDSLAALPALRIELARDRASRWLFRAAMRQLAGRTEPEEPTSRPLGTTRIHLTQFALLLGWRFKLSELVRQVRVAAV